MSRLFNLCTIIMLSTSLLYCADNFSIEIVSHPSQPLHNADIIGLAVHPLWNHATSIYEAPEADRATNFLLVLSRSPAIPNPETLHALAHEIAQQQPQIKSLSAFRALCQSSTSTIIPGKTNTKDLIFFCLGLRGADCAISYFEDDEIAKRFIFDHTTEHHHLDGLYALCRTLVCNPSDLISEPDPLNRYSWMHAQKIVCAQTIAVDAQQKLPKEAFHFVLNLSKFRKSND